MTRLEALVFVLIGFVLGVVLGLAFTAAAHGPRSTETDLFGPDETLCVCSRIPTPEDVGVIDPCASGVAWRSIIVDPPDIVRTVRQAQTLAKLREKLANPAPIAPPLLEDPQP